MTELRKEREAQFTKEEIAFIAVTLLEAGSDTTRLTMVSFIAAAAMYPDWVRTAQKQLDEVCGENAERLPTFEDTERLPYIQAVAKEATRWRYVEKKQQSASRAATYPRAKASHNRPSNTQTGVPHALTKDDDFEGYRFPAGTVVTWNHWAISNDSKEYHDPLRFWPERYLDDDVSKPLKGHLGFGAGT